MEYQKNLKDKVLNGLVWSFLERIAAQGVSFIVSVLLARLLLPSEYGAVSLVLVFIALANVFVSTGLGESLVQKSNADETDFSTMFYISLITGILLYGILFIVAPFVGTFYKMPELVLVLRVLALKIPISAISTIQHAYVSKHMMFKRFFWSTLGGTLISGIIGIAMAYKGAGVWALVFQYLTNTLIDTIVLFFTVDWRPKLLFSVKSAKELFNFGWKIVAANLVNTTYSEARSLIIGSVYTAADLAFYNKGMQFPSLAITNIDSAIGKVAFPAMVQVKDEPARLKQVGRRAMKTTSYIIFPLMMGLAMVAEPVVRLLLTDKWILAVPYVQLGCLFYACQPIQTTNWQIIKAMGRSDLCFKLEIVKKIIGLTLLFGTMKLGPLAIAVSGALFGVISMLINIAPNKTLIGYSYKEQFYDLLPVGIMTLITAGCIYFVSRMMLPTIAELILEVITGIIVFVGLSAVSRNDSYLYLLTTIKSRFIRRKK